MLHFATVIFCYILLQSYFAKVCNNHICYIFLKVYFATFFLKHILLHFATVIFWQICRNHNLLKSSFATVFWCAENPAFITSQTSLRFSLSTSLKCEQLSAFAHDMTFGVKIKFIGLGTCQFYKGSFATSIIWLLFDGEVSVTKHHLVIKAWAPFISLTHICVNLFTSKVGWFKESEI